MPGAVARAGQLLECPQLNGRAVPAEIVPTPPRSHASGTPERAGTTNYLRRLTEMSDYDYGYKHDYDYNDCYKPRRRRRHHKKRYDHCWDYNYGC
ncbi:hypothetical protein GCM10020369_70360 [Cryptosporangium minutisporangium]|uniref:Uncharacterized protein n=1 Tax=Cryptosporangium minutisporangium TaxID=113569 RepID=A0ABP6TAH8_9ACTN